MATKGLVYVPAGGAVGWQGEAPGLQLVANRPLVAHALDALADDGIEELAVLAAPEALESIHTGLGRDLRSRPAAAELALDGGGDLGDALTAAAAFVGDEPAVLHLATGLLMAPLQPLRRSVERADVGSDLVLLLDQGPDPESPLDTLAERLLGISALGADGDRLGLAGVAGFGAGALGRAAAGASDAPAPIAPASIAPAPRALLALAERFCAEGLRVTAGLGRGWCRYSSAPRDLLELNRGVLDCLPMTSGPAVNASNRIEGRVMVDPTAEVDSSVLLGPCLIGAGARITDSYIGPYTTVGPRAQIEGSEVARSVVAEGARIANVAGRIEGSTIGPAANIFRDFSLPRALRLHVGAGVEVAFD